MSFMARLNCHKSVIYLSDGGKLFHAAGPTTEKALFSNSILLRRTSTGGYKKTTAPRGIEGKKSGLAPWRSILSRNRSLQHASEDIICSLCEN